MRESRVVFVLALLLLPTLAAPQEQDARRTGEDDALLIVAFSGGGTRAAAFGYGVSQAMRETRAGDRPFIDRIDRVAGVSGGSFLATGNTRARTQPPTEAPHGGGAEVGADPGVEALEHTGSISPEGDKHQ